MDTPPFDARPPAATGLQKFTAKAAADGTLAEFSFLTDSTYSDFFLSDINHAQGRVKIENPYMTTRGVERLSEPLARAVKRGVTVCLYIQEPAEWTDRGKRGLDPALAVRLKNFETSKTFLEALGVHVNLRRKIHAKIACFDEDITWLGSLNFLSHYDTQEQLTRIESASVLQWIASTYNLHSCDSCPKVECAGTAEMPAPEVFIGNAIAQRRKKLAITQRALALKTGISQSAISAIEQGSAKSLLTTCFKICHALDMDVRLVPLYLLNTVDRLEQ